MPDLHPVRPDSGVVVEEARPEVKQPPLYPVSYTHLTLPTN